MVRKSQQRHLVYIAYLDDSDTRQKSSKWQVMSAVIVRDSQFRHIELRMELAADMLLPSEKREKFEEFHACELYGGFGIFDGIERPKRMAVIEGLLRSIQMQDLPVVYGAVNLHELNNLVYASADPLDVAFRICAEGIDDWLDRWLNRHFRQLQNRQSEVSADELLANDMAILIADDCEGKTKAAIQRSFRSMRKRFRQRESSLKWVHDDMYFGDSKFSIGIQLADLSSYFIARHLEGDSDADIDYFYKLIEPHIVSSRIEPTKKSKEGE